MGILPDYMIKEEVGITPPAEYTTKRPGIISYGIGSYGFDARVGYKFKVFQPYGGTEIDPKNFDQRLYTDVDLTPPALPTSHIFPDQENKKDADPCCCACGIPESMRAKDSEGNSLPCPARPAVITHVPCPDCGGNGKTRKAGMRIWQKTPCQKCQGTGEIPAQNPSILIPPHSFSLAESLEEFKIPRSTLAIVLGKSTYARCGLIVNVTPLEPEWQGKVTIELSNTTPLPLRVYCGEGIMQVLFLRTDGVGAALVAAMLATTNEHQGDVCKTLLGHATCDKSYADKGGKYQNQTGLVTPLVDGPIDPDQQYTLTKEGEELVRKAILGEITAYAGCATKSDDEVLALPTTIWSTNE